MWGMRQRLTAETEARVIWIPPLAPKGTNAAPVLVSDADSAPWPVPVDHPMTRVDPGRLAASLSSTPCSVASSSVATVTTATSMFALAGSCRNS